MPWACSVAVRARMARLGRKMTKVLARFVDGEVVCADSCELALVRGALAGAGGTESPNNPTDYSRLAEPR